MLYDSILYYKPLAEARIGSRRSRARRWGERGYHLAAELGCVCPDAKHALPEAKQNMIFSGGLAAHPAKLLSVRRGFSC